MTFIYVNDTSVPLRNKPQVWLLLFYLYKCWHDKLYVALLKCCFFVSHYQSTSINLNSHHHLPKLTTFGLTANTIQLYFKWHSVNFVTSVKKKKKKSAQKLIFVYLIMLYSLTQVVTNLHKTFNLTWIYLLMLPYFSPLWKQWTHLIFSIHNQHLTTFRLLLVIFLASASLYLTKLCIFSISISLS
jgi:hypothetical protein